MPALHWPDPLDCRGCQMMDSVIPMRLTDSALSVTGWHSFEISLYYTLGSTGPGRTRTCNQCTGITDRCDLSQALPIELRGAIHLLKIRVAGRLFRSAPERTYFSPSTVEVGRALGYLSTGPHRPSASSSCWPPPLVPGFERATSPASSHQDHQLRCLRAP